MPYNFSRESLKCSAVITKSIFILTFMVGVRLEFGHTRLNIRENHDVVVVFIFYSHFFRVVWAPALSGQR